MAFRPVNIEKSQRGESIMSITRDSLSFNSHFCKTEDLLSKKAVRFFVDDANPYTMGFSFLDEREEGTPALGMAGRSPGMTNPSNGRTCKVAAVTERWPVLKAIQSLEKVSQRRFPIKKDVSGIYVVHLAPSFEHVSSKESFAGELKGNTGIYRLKDEGHEVIYIGKGNLVDRIRHHLSSPWGNDIYRLEYSIINDAAQESKWELYHHEQFHNIHGKLPTNNRIKGHDPLA